MFNPFKGKSNDDDNANLMDGQDDVFGGLQTHSLSNGYKMEILVALPNSYDKGKELAKDFLDGKVLVVNFVCLSSAEKQRIFDYLNGVAYTINADIKQITTDTIVYLPSNFAAIKASYK